MIPLTPEFMLPTILHEMNKMRKDFTLSENLFDLNCVLEYKVKDLKEKIEKQKKTIDKLKRKKVKK